MKFTKKKLLIAILIPTLTVLGTASIAIGTHVTTTSGFLRITPTTIVNRNLNLQAHWTPQAPAGQINITERDVWPNRSDRVPARYMVVVIHAQYCMACFGDHPTMPHFYNGMMAQEITPAGQNNRPLNLTTAEISSRWVPDGYIVSNGQKVIRPGGSAWSNAEMNNHQQLHNQGHLDGPNNRATDNIILLIDTQTDRAVGWWFQPPAIPTQPQQTAFTTSDNQIRHIKHRAKRVL